MREYVRVTVSISIFYANAIAKNNCGNKINREEETLVIHHYRALRGSCIYDVTRLILTSK